MAQESLQPIESCLHNLGKMLHIREVLPRRQGEIPQMKGNVLQHSGEKTQGIESLPHYAGELPWLMRDVLQSSDKLLHLRGMMPHLSPKRRQLRGRSRWFAGRMRIKMLELPQYSCLLRQTCLIRSKSEILLP